MPVLPLAAWIKVRNPASIAVQRAEQDLESRIKGSAHLWIS
jgi:hypothetical protein